MISAGQILNFAENPKMRSLDVFVSGILQKISV